MRNVCLSSFQILPLCVLLMLAGRCAAPSFSTTDKAFDQALANGRLANEGFARCERFVTGWLAQADSATGLIPRNLKKNRDIWNAKDAAADNYPFMVLTAAITDRALFEGRMIDMLRTETRLTSRIGSLPDTWSFAKQDFADDEPELGRILFGASEYIKDGLLPLTEWLGLSPWSSRMLDMLEDMWARAPIETPYGAIVSDSHEINGEMLQILARLYWMTGRAEYLAWAVRLGDYYLLGDRHPTRDSNYLRLRDHGCEIVSGLCELYATVHFALPEKKAAYRAPLHAMLDRILEVGRNDDGLFYNLIDPQAGTVEDDRVADTFGYTLNGYYTVYLIDGAETYRAVVLQALEALNTNYRSYAWEGESADGYADAIESGLNLYNREPVSSAADWLDSEIQVMWAKQQPDGIIEGWHGDGNFARTTIMYCLWKTQGLTIEPWREDVVFGAVLEGGVLKIALQADEPWEGRLIFDRPRHEAIMHLPLDWPRINQFPEWFTVPGEHQYRVSHLTSGEKGAATGQALQAGLPIQLKAGQVYKLVVQ